MPTCFVYPIFLLHAHSLLKLQRLREVQLERQKLVTYTTTLEQKVESLTYELRVARKPNRGKHAIKATEDDRIKWAAESSVVLVDPYLDSSTLLYGPTPDGFDFFPKDRFTGAGSLARSALCQAAEVRAHIAEHGLLALLDDPQRSPSFRSTVRFETTYWPCAETDIQTLAVEESVG